MPANTSADEVLSALSLTSILASKRIAALPADRRAAADAFLEKLSALPGEWTSLTSTDLGRPAPEGPSAGASAACPEEFRGKSGKIARIGFTYVFGSLTAADIAWLQSPAASDEFKTRGAKILLINNAANQSLIRDPTGTHHRRYYSGRVMGLLRNGNLEYYLCNSWFDESIAPLLKWFKTHRLSRKKVKELLAAAP